MTLGGRDLAGMALHRTVGAIAASLVSIVAVGCLVAAFAFGLSAVALAVQWRWGAALLCWLTGSLLLVGFTAFAAFADWLRGAGDRRYIAAWRRRRG